MQSTEHYQNKKSCFEAGFLECGERFESARGGLITNVPTSGRDAINRALSKQKIPL
jgi:hypothetical protein